jgi:TP901 family phage tail tape measure protein
LNAIDLQAISQSAQNLSQGFEQFNSHFVSYETGLAEVSSITGVTGAALDDLGKKAKASAEEFGGKATDSLNTYKILLSRLGPDIAKSPEALEKMEHNVRLLSKTMGNDAAGAVDALTTSMLQFQSDLTDPIAAQAEMTRMMNIMAAGAKAGTAEVPELAAALKNVGVQASRSKLSFEETNAALQLLINGGKQGAEAGVGLRNVLAKMAGEDIISKDGVEKLKKTGVNMKIVSDTTLPLTTRLRELSKLSKDATGLDQVFGVENAAAAGILLRTVDAQDKLKKQTIDTNVAQQQANIMMDTQAEKHSRMTAWFENAKIAIGGYTAAYSPYISVGADSISMMANFKNAHEGGSIALKGLKTMLGLSEKASLLSTIKTKGLSIVQGIWTGITNIAAIAQTNLNLAMEANPIGMVVLAIVALIAVVAVIIKYWDDWGAAMSLLLGPIGLIIGAFKSLYDHWESIKTAFQTDGIIGGLKRIGMVILDAILKPMQQMFEMIGLDSWAKKIEKFRTSNKLVTIGEADPKEKAKVKPKAKTTSNVEIDNKKAGIDLTKYGAVPASKTDKKGDGTSTGNSGNVSKSIVQNLTINNHFPDGATKDTRKLADELTGHIIDRLRDSTILIDQ